MPRLFRQFKTKAIPAGARIVTVKGGMKLARWTDTQEKEHSAFLNEAGDRLRIPSEKWYGEWRDADGNKCREPLAANKDAARIMLNEKVKEAELAKAGIRNPFQAHDSRRLAEHLADYRRELEARGNEPRYVRETIARLEALLEGCDFQLIPDLSASRAMDWLASLREKGSRRVTLDPAKEWYTMREAAAILGVTPAFVGTIVNRDRLPAVGRARARRLPRATVEALQNRKTQGVSVSTSNQYLTHLKGFCNWLVRDRRVAENPFTHFEGGNADVDRRHDRRELAADELRMLLKVTRESDRSFRGLTGQDRYVLYATACGTGFRAAALASLTPESFDLDADTPTVTLAARRNKSRVLKVQPIPPDVADLLREYIGAKPAGKPVWGGTWASARKGATMLRIDLDVAGIPYEVSGPDGPLFADFHALRHTYLTLGGRAGIDLRTLQELAGHSSPTLTARYSHRRLHDLAGAVEKLPNFLPDSKESATEGRSTGTDG